MPTNNAINLSDDGFSAYLNTTVFDVTGNGDPYIVLFDTLSSGTGYNTATGIWTCPTSGTYLIGLSLYFNNIGPAHNYFTVYINRPVRALLMISANAAAIVDPIASIVLPPACTLMSLTAGNQLSVEIAVFNSTKTVGLFGYDSGSASMSSYFWARKILA